MPEITMVSALDAAYTGISERSTRLTPSHLLHNGVPNTDREKTHFHSGQDYCPPYPGKIAVSFRPENSYSLMPDSVLENIFFVLGFTADFPFLAAERCSTKDQR